MATFAAIAQKDSEERKLAPTSSINPQ